MMAALTEMTDQDVVHQLYGYMDACVFWECGALASLHFYDLWALTGKSSV